MGYINPTGKLLRFPDRLAAWRNGKVFAPIGMELDLSNRCNLGCKFCHFAYTHSRGPLARPSTRYLDMGDLIDFDLLAGILQEMAEFGVKSVTFTGGGEPTLHPRFCDAVAEARRCGLEVGLYTNATLIDEDKARAIKENCTWVVVSLDEATDYDYERVKQADAFQKACDGVRRLVAAPGEAVIGASFLVSWRQHQGFIAHMQSLALGLGADYMEFRPRVIFDEDEPGVAAESTAWVKDALKTWRGWNSTAPGTDIRFEQFELYADYHRDYEVCYAPFFTGIVTPNGKVWRCVNRRGFADSLVGDLNVESFRDVWAKQRPQTDFAKCRVLCRGDVLNRQLWKMAQPLPHEEFV